MSLELFHKTADWRQSLDAAKNFGADALTSAKDWASQPLYNGAPVNRGVAIGGGLAGAAGLYALYKLLNSDKAQQS